MRRTLFLVLALLVLLSAPAAWFLHIPFFGEQHSAPYTRALAVSGAWSAHNYDLVYTVAFSSAAQPNGPLVAYRASGTNLQDVVPVAAVARGPQVATPLFFPSPNGRYLALLTPQGDSYNNNLNGAALQLFATNGQRVGATLAVALPSRGVADADQVIWSPDSQSLYYHSGTQNIPAISKTIKRSASRRVGAIPCGCPVISTGGVNDISGVDEIHRVYLRGHNVVVWRQPQNGASLRLVGVDRSGNLVMMLARPGQPVALLRLNAKTNQIQPVMTLPSDILPGNVLGIGSAGASVICERVLNWQPLRYTFVSIGFKGAVKSVPSLFDTARYGAGLAPLARSGDGRVLAMSQVLSQRSDLAAQGIAGVPAQEALLLADAATGATQRLILPPGGQIVQAFWTAHMPVTQLHAVSQNTLHALLTASVGADLSRPPNVGGANASVFQQDEWMLEGHAGLLADAPTPSKMCYGTCPQGDTDPAHVSAAILHGIAYVESDWHQFNDSSYDVGGEPIGSPVESYDGGWGQYQQTWGMPPQCQQSNNCRPDASSIQHDQSYNIGTGVASLISAWNDTAGVASNSDPNDPYKANDWFFAVWAYNGSYGNNPDDVPSSVYGHWYPGAPFRSIYEEYVWYFAAHNTYSSNGWTDNYLPSLGSALLPPQSDFANTSDSFVYCVTCTIPDWTSGTYDREWVGMDAPNQTIAGYFTAAFNQNGGENVVGLPRDNGGGAGVHGWGSGLNQDFGGGSAQPGAIMLANGSTTPYWVYGGVWAQYLGVDHGAVGCHGYPTSPLRPYPDPLHGTDSVQQQLFQQGYIIWDATTHSIVGDLCQGQRFYPGA
ncbi:MAG: hypothetical protein WCD86_06925 [Ktedonobacteraceae bacterium]